MARKMIKSQTLCYPLNKILKGMLRVFVSDPLLSSAYFLPILMLVPLSAASFLYGYLNYGQVCYCVISLAYCKDK